MTVPKQKPGKSEQTVGTPSELITAVINRFGPLMADLACTRSNAVASSAYAIEEGDSLAREWPSRNQGLCWLNPPFSDIAPWAKKAASGDSQVAMLVPASIGSNWFRDHVHRKAYVLALNPRVTFVGHTSPYPKDLILCVYGDGLSGFDVWNWRTGRVP